MPRLSKALGDTLAHLQGGDDPAEVAANLIRKRAEAAALRARLPGLRPTASAALRAYPGT